VSYRLMKWFYIGAITMTAYNLVHDILGPGRWR